MKRLKKILSSAVPNKIQKPIGTFAYNNFILAQRKILGAKEKFAGGIHYLEIDKGHKENLLLIHGFSDSKDGFLMPALYLSKRYNLIIPDLPGFGANEREHSRTYSIEHLSSAVLSLVEELKLTSIHVLGVSMGAAVAMETVLEKGDFVKSLGLISPAGFFEEDKNCIYHEILDGNNIFCIEDHHEYDQFLSRVMNKRPYIPKPIELHLADTLIKDRKWLNKMAIDLIGGVNDLSEKEKIARVSYNNRAQHINCPTLVIWGEDDSLFPVTLAEVAKREIKNSTIIIIPDVGHALHHEIPKIFSREVHKFLRTL